MRLRVELEELLREVPLFVELPEGFFFAAAFGAALEAVLRDDDVARLEVERVVDRAFVADPRLLPLFVLAPVLLLFAVRVPALREGERFAAVPREPVPPPRAAVARPPVERLEAVRAAVVFLAPVARLVVERAVVFLAPVARLVVERAVVFLAPVARLVVDRAVVFLAPVARLVVERAVVFLAPLEPAAERLLVELEAAAVGFFAVERLEPDRLAVVFFFVSLLAMQPPSFTSRFPRRVHRFARRLLPARRRLGRRCRRGDRPPPPRAGAEPGAGPSGGAPRRGPGADRS